MFSSSVVSGLKAWAANEEGNPGGRKRCSDNLLRIPVIQEESVLSQVLISVSQSNFDSYKYPCSFFKR